MLGRLFKKAAAARPIDTARVPDGMRVYAIGDVHGRADLLHELLLKIEDDSLARGAADTHIIFLGDLMDRGPDSAGVIETAMALRAAGRKVRFLMGNHEEVFLRACRKNDAKITRFFIRIGGEATVLSYPITRAEYMALDMHELSERLRTLVPQSHLEFIDSFEDQIVIGDYAFVHAGIRPGVSLAEQNPAICAGFERNLSSTGATSKRSLSMATPSTTRSKSGVPGSASTQALMRQPS